MIGFGAMVAMTVGGVVAGAATRNLNKFGEEMQPFSPNSGNLPPASGISSISTVSAPPPPAFPLMNTEKMNGYRVKVRGRVTDPGSISSIGSMFDDYNVSDIRQGMSNESVERLMNRTIR